MGRSGAVLALSIGFRFGEEEFRPGIIALVTPVGSVRQVAEGIAFPNGMVVTRDNKTLIVAESFTGKLTAFDIAASPPTAASPTAASGPTSAVRAAATASASTRRAPSGAPSCTTAGPPASASTRGGEVLQRIELDQACFACMLGGEDGRTLFMMVAEWLGVQRMGELFSSHTGQMLTCAAPAPHAGWP